MFNKREQAESGITGQDERTSAPAREPRSEPKVRSGGHTAVIGPSINVDGKLRGEEDLVIEGKVKGTVELKKHSVTIGANGQVQADIYAHSIFVEGRMDGNLYAAEQVVIRKSAEVKGSVVSPRVSLEDGARFNGSIDMDAESDVLKKAFSGARPSVGQNGKSQDKAKKADDTGKSAGSASGKSANQALGI